MEEMSSRDELGREVARQGRSGEKDAMRDGIGTGRALGEIEDADGIQGGTGAAISRERDLSLGSGGSVSLGERLALQNELDELRSERKKWLHTAAAGAAGGVAYPFLMGEVEAPGDLIGHVVFAVVFVVLLLIPVVRKQSRIHKLEARLDGLDEGDEPGVPGAPVGHRSAAALAGPSRDPGGDGP